MADDFFQLALKQLKEEYQTPQKLSTAFQPPRGASVYMVSVFGADKDETQMADDGWPVILQKHVRGPKKTDIRGNTHLGIFVSVDLGDFATQDDLEKAVRVSLTNARSSGLPAATNLDA
jgi:hypothetical protein